MKIRKVTTDADLLKCSDVILELRPHLKGRDLAAMFKRMQSETFRIIYIEEKGKAVAFAGYRDLTMFFSGKTLYIDDLCTLPEHRGKGYGGELLDYVIREAKENRYDAVTLDSGHHRNDAHRLYLNKGFIIESHHFHISMKGHSR
jgi:GNAT superfamily N-acetyltransferase